EECNHRSGCSCDGDDLRDRPLLADGPSAACRADQCATEQTHRGRPFFTQSERLHHQTQNHVHVASLTVASDFDLGPALDSTRLIYLTISPLRLDLHRGELARHRLLKLGLLRIWRDPVEFQLRDPWAQYERAGKPA